MSERPLEETDDTSRKDHRSGAVSAEPEASSSTNTAISGSHGDSHHQENSPSKKSVSSNPQKWFIALFILGAAWIVLGSFIIVDGYNQAGSIQITWQTESEFETAGFNIYRSQSPDGNFEQINPQLIPSQADAAAGAAYTFIDDNVQPGVVYFYVLEDVEYDNSRERHEDSMIIGQVEGFSISRIMLISVSFLFGLGLIAMGIREMRQS